MKKLSLILIFLLITALTGCANQIMDGPGMVNSYKQIDQETAKQMMGQDDGHVVVDVRTQEEYDAGHIPGALLIPNESIGTEPPEELPDRNQIILIYCRSGNRSKQAAQKLANMGYTSIYEFGGIITWPGEIVTAEAPATPQPAGQPAALRFDSFDGGGPEYSVEVEDPALVSVESARRYASADHEELDGAGYTVTVTFTGVQPGQTRATVKARSPIAENFDAVYAVTVDDDLNVTLERIEYNEL